MPDPIGVMKIWQICKPIKKANAMITGVNVPLSWLYAGLVNSRYRYARRADKYPTNREPIVRTGPVKQSLTSASIPRSFIIFQVSFAAGM